MKLIALCILLTAWSPIFSQVSAPEVADSLFRNRNWVAAASAYERITKANPRPKTGMSFNRLGVCYYNVGKYRDAILAFKRAIEISGNSNVMYSLACTYNKVSQRDSCYHWLAQAANRGFIQYQQCLDDEDLRNLHGESAFQTILQKIKYNALPCSRQPEFRQLDFWLGVWTVYDTRTNKIAGSSEIQLVLGECVILENWQPVMGPAAKSFSIYNLLEKKWRQIYVDANGTYSEYYDGIYADGTIQFKLKSGIQSDTLRRMTFTRKSDVAVDQVGEASTDRGKTWSIEYALTYKK